MRRTQKRLLLPPTALAWGGQVACHRASPCPSPMKRELVLGLELGLPRGLCTEGSAEVRVRPGAPG